jgi:hypothetical protein
MRLTNFVRGSSAVLRLAALQNRCQGGMLGLEKLRSLTEENCLTGMLVRLAEKLGPGESARFECGSPSRLAR